jgi:hypothetical protein
MEKDMTRTRKKTRVIVVAVAAALGLSAANSWSALVYSQDFESSAAATEYASGDFNPAAAAPPSTQVIRGENAGFENVIQVVNASTDPGTAHAPQVIGLNSLKIDSSAGDGCCPVMDVHPWGQGNSNPGTLSTIALSFYGVPGAGGSPRLLEVYGSPAAGDPFGPFTFAFRFDEDGTVFYDSGGWQVAEFTVSQNQWNHIAIASFSDGVSADFVEINLNGTVYSNSGTGYGDANTVSPSTDRFHFGGQTPTGTETALIFVDNVLISNAYNLQLPEPGSLALLAMGFVMLRRFRRVA